MGLINEYLKKIKEAIYGEEVRGSIHDAIEQCYKDATGHPESVAAVVEEMNIERKRLDNLFANGTAQTQEIGKVILTTPQTDIPLIMNYLAANVVYDEMFSGAIPRASDFLIVSSNSHVKLLKAGLYHMKFRAKISQYGGLPEIPMRISIQYCDSQDGDYTDLKTEYLVFPKTSSETNMRNVEFIFTITEPSYIRLAVTNMADDSNSGSSIFSFYASDCAITALDWKGKKSADLSELHDVRIGADGTVYGTAGDAVREQFKNATKEIQNFEGATLNDAGARGLVPAPEEGMTQHVLTSVGTWEKFVAQWFDDGTGVRIGLGPSYSCDITQATGRKIGFMGADDKEKLDKYPEYGELEKTIQGLENKIDAMQGIITKIITAPTLSADEGGKLQITENEEG